MRRNRAETAKRRKAAGRVLAKGGVAVSPEGVEWLLSTLSGRLVLYLSVAVKNACGIAGCFRKRLAWKAGQEKARNCLTALAAAVSACSSQAELFRARISEIYLPRLDALIAESGSGSPDATARARESYRLILEEHETLLRGHSKKLAETAVSLRAVMRPVAPGSARSSSSSWLLNPRSTAWSAAFDGEYALNAVIMKPMESSALGVGMEPLFREISEILVGGGGEDV
ncbi:MAG: hypothetical protein LBQ12_03245 [Deltaproteobacteria bacterium]|nr:hypothetical protein [Deltaproteobacteria bacterium]